MSEAAFDVVIAGGGMVGASLAVAVAPLGLTVAVVEQVPPDAASQPSYDDRATAVSAGSQRIFDTVGVWPAIASGATPIRRIHVSDRGKFGKTAIDHADYGLSALGYVVENRVLGSALWRELGRSASVTTMTPVSVRSVETTEGGVVVGIDGEDGPATLTARLLVAADGARSRVRDMLGAHSEVRPYEQTAVIANVTPERFHEHVAYERFTDSGPVAFLPMSNGRCSVVWTIDSDETARVSALDETAFLTELQERFGHRLGRLRRAGQRAWYPLNLVTVDEVTLPRAVLVGNAAHGLHPVAGQGFNLGLRDVAALAEVIADDRRAAAAEGRATDPGSPEVLRAYRRWRREDQNGTVDFTDGLVRLFTNPFGPLGAARGLGLMGLDLLAPARHRLAARSMGIAGRLPRLARGLPLL